MNEIKKVCGMCKHSRPNPKSKEVFCGLNPPQLIVLSQVNPITQQQGQIYISMLPHCLVDIICSHFEYDSAAQRKLVETK